MARRWRRKDIKFYDYVCTLTGEKFRMTKEAKNPDDLMSVKAYYDLHPEKDDRPESVKKKIGLEEIHPEAPHDDPDSAPEEDGAGVGKDTGGEGVPSERGPEGGSDEKLVELQPVKPA